ncbi:MAG: tetratricopeptide repeat protein [Myxococcota bacterium]
MFRLNLNIATSIILFSVSLYGQVATSPSDSTGLQNEEELLKAIEFYSDGKYPDAISILKKYIEKNPDDKEAYIMLGKSFVYSKDCTEAVNIFKKIDLILDKKDKDLVYKDIAQCYVQDKRYKEAKEYLNSIKDSSIDKDGVRYLLATLNMATQNLSDAKPIFIELYNNSPLYKSRSAYYLAVISQSEKSLSDSIKYLEVASLDKESEEGREASRILENIAQERERFQKKSLFKPFFKLRNTYLIDTNVPEMAENEDESVKYLTNLGAVSMRWGARTDLELSGGVNFKKERHKASATLTYFTDYHFLPINSMIPRSEFDVNYYDIMFIYAGSRYNYDFVFNKNRLSPGIEVGLLNLFTDPFGSFVHEKGAESGPNFFLTSLMIAPNLIFSLSDTMMLKPYYRLKMDFYHQSIDEPNTNSLSGIDHNVGLESPFFFGGDDTAILRVEYDINNADGSQGRYSGLRLGFGLSLVALSIIDLRLLMDYFIRDFSDSQYPMEDGSIKSRSDKRLSLNAGPEFILGKGGRIGIKYNFILNQSNIKKTYDYTRHMGILFWELKF